MSFKERRQKEKRLKATRKAQKRQANELVVGVGWYTPQQWAALTEVVPDRSELDDNYAEWEAQAEKTLRTIRAQGLSAVQIPVDVSELVEWCQNQGRTVDGGARAEYVRHVLAQQHGPHDPQG